MIQAIVALGQDGDHKKAAAPAPSLIHGVTLNDGSNMEVVAQATIRTSEPTPCEPAIGFSQGLVAPGTPSDNDGRRIFSGRCQCPSGFRSCA